MYTIKADNNIIHNVILADDKRVVEAPKIDEEVNKSSILTFSMCPCNPEYNNIKKLKTIITVYEDDEEIFNGRVLETTEDYYRKKHVYCESDLSFLVDSKQRPYSFSGEIHQVLSRLIKEHNTQIQDNEKQFSIGTVSVTNSSPITISDSSYQSTLDAIKTKLIDAYGGYIRIMKDGTVKKIDYLKSLGMNDSQVIRFEENIIDFSRFISSSDVFTALIPLGAEIDGERLTIASVNGGNDYVYNQNAVNEFGWIFETNAWDDATVPEDLLSKGIEHLQEGITSATTIELTAVDLHLIHNDISKIRCGEAIRVISEPHGIDMYMMASKLSTDLENPQNSKVTLGHVCKCYTEM